MGNTENWKGGLGMQRVVHERRRHAPERRELMLKRAAELAGLSIEGTQAEAIDGVWVHVLARKGTQLIALDAWTREGSAMKKVRTKKGRLLAQAGIPYIRIRARTSEEGSVLILKALLKGGIR